VLYAPSNPDDPVYRADIAALTGGVVDYFDAFGGTPGLALLQNYDVVYTWTNNAYADRVAFGNVLADYVDGGGKVLLGAFCTYTNGNSLGGRIMTADYSPVWSPTGGNHFTLMNYGGSGTSYQHRDVGFYSEIYRDELDLQGLGVWDGTYTDGELATAHRPDGRVMYFNGAGPGAGGAGDQERIVANFAKWTFIGGSMFGATEAGGYYGMNWRTGIGVFVGNLPLGPTADIDYDEVTGAAYSAAAPFGDRLHAFNVATGAGIGGSVATPGGTYSALEAINGLWYGCYHAFACGGSSLTRFDPTTGNVLSGPFATGVGPIVGMSFNIELNRMYYVTDSSCPGGSQLYWNSSPGAALTGLGNVGFSAGAIEFGPDQNLYGVNVGANSKLYRINPTTGISSQIGTLTGLSGMTGLMRVSGAQTVDAGGFGGAPLTGLALASPLPNPSLHSSSVVLRFSLPRAGSARIALYDVSGRCVWKRTEAALAAGEHTITWDGRTLDGAIAHPGVYVARLESEQGGRTAKLLRL
jgi:hypothetical protein